MIFVGNGLTLTKYCGPSASTTQTASTLSVRLRRIVGVARGPLWRGAQLEATGYSTKGRSCLDEFQIVLCKYLTWCAFVISEFCMNKTLNYYSVQSDLQKIFWVWNVRLKKYHFQMLFQMSKLWWNFLKKISKKNLAIYGLKTEQNWKRYCKITRCIFSYRQSTKILTYVKLSYEFTAICCLFCLKEQLLIIICW